MIKTTFKAISEVGGGHWDRWKITFPLRRCNEIVHRNYQNVYIYAWIHVKNICKNNIIIFWGGGSSLKDYKNSMSSIFQLLLTRFWPNFKSRFLGPSSTDINFMMSPWNRMTYNNFVARVTKCSRSFLIEIYGWRIACAVGSVAKY